MSKTRRIEIVFEILRIVAAFLIAYLFILVVLVLISDVPGKAIYNFSIGPFSTARRFGGIIQKAIPLVFTGWGMCFMYAVNRFNLIGEGVFIMSACMTTLIAIALEPLQLPKVVMVSLLLVISLIMGGAIAFVPAVINSKLNANIIVVSIMLNYILLFLTQYILTRLIRDTEVSYTASKSIPLNAKLENIIPQAGIHSGIIIMAAVYILVVLLFFKMPAGYTMRTVGSNPEFARHVGIKVTTTVVMAQVIGGALASFGGAVEQLGMNDRFQWTELTQHGMNGVVVAVLAKKNPIFVPITAFLLAYIKQGAEVVNRTADIPAEFIIVIQGIIILLVAADSFLSSARNRMIFKSALSPAASLKTNS